MTAIRVTAIERVVRIVARGGTGVATINVELPLTSTGGSTPTLAILPATETTPGTLSAEDKAKLNALADPTLSSAVPQPLGNAGPGTSTQAARGDHVHAHGAQAGGGLHSTATTTAAGFMSAADKTKLNGIATGAQVNVPTNLGVGGTGDARTITSSTGTSAALPLATPSTAGLLSTFYATLLANFAGNVRAQVLAMLQQGSNVTLTPGGSGATQTLTISASGTGGGGSGTVTSVQASGGSTGLSFSGGPVTTSGTLILGGTLAIASGGTGATTAEGARAAIGAGTGNGTVTSVGLTLPSIFSVSSSPVTGAGTITATLASQTASRVWASPAGSDGAPTFRELLQGDIPALSASKIVLSDDRLLGQVSGGSAATQIALGTGLSFVATTLTLSANLQGWNAIAPSSKQDTLVSGTNIKTINSESLLGSSNISIPVISSLGSISGVVISSPSATQVLTFDGTNWVNSAPSGGGGLTHFTESVNTSAPNATVPVVRLLATNAATNVDAAFTPKGTGAILAQIPDGTTVGGNKRGSGAVDFQSSRSAATQVASGTRAAILTGANNTNSSANGGILGGTSNTLSNAGGAIAGGQNNTVSNSNAFCGAGLSNTVSGNQAGVVCGVSNQATEQRAFVGGGLENQATGESSWIPGGVQSSTRGLFAAYSWSGARRSSNFDNQCIGMTVQGGTTNATPLILTAQRGGASTSNVMVLPNNSCWTGTVHITGRSSGGDVYYRRLDVVGARGASAATTTVKATSPAYTFTDTGLTGVSVTVVANTTRGSLEVEVTGLAATTIDWFAHFDAGNQIVR
ncbi:TPA_asm: putative tail fiber protein [Cyanophage Cy-LDV1]|nr:TPA_asm: putative tail fiber protein [Cyanophage Cy-LDV1]